jgi:dTDP-3-amino-2,3,6-trideoxy-4-keto-D-glucose/dTDP-3-amino-3,4,6-trideoxy-alpha-D-glucose/dTDP-2,6-dideoxy-D-kanosamine transaminase
MVPISNNVIRSLKSKMKIPLNNLSRETGEIQSGLDEATARVLKRGWFLMGKELADFEKAFATYMGMDYCIALANGTDALEFALHCIGIEARDQVIVAPNAGMYASIAVLRTNAEPVFADVDDNSLCMSADTLDKTAVTASAKAVIVTHLYGQMADMESILAVAARHNLFVIEDCAQAHGARKAGRFAGSFGDIACFSFYPTKNLGALGDAGALVTNNFAFAETARALRQYGWKSRKYQVELPHGRNSRLDELQAAFLLVKLPRLDQRNTRRRAIWQYYHDSLGTRLRFIGRGGEDFVAHLCVARSTHRDVLRQRLADHGIDTDIHYPIPDHHQPVWREMMSHISTPIAEQACQEVLTLPCFPEMTDNETSYVVDALRKYL